MGAGLRRSFVGGGAGLRRSKFGGKSKKSKSLVKKRKVAKKTKKVVTLGSENRSTFDSIKEAKKGGKKTRKSRR